MLRNLNGKDLSETCPIQKQDTNGEPYRDVEVEGTIILSSNSYICSSHVMNDSDLKRASHTRT